MAGSHVSLSSAGGTESKHHRELVKRGDQFFLTRRTGDQRSPAFQLGFVALFVTPLRALLCLCAAVAAV